MLNVSNVRVAYQTLNIDRAERVEKNLLLQMQTPLYYLDGLNRGRI